MIKCLLLFLKKLSEFNKVHKYIFVANLLENLLESSDKVTTDYDKRDEATEVDIKVSRTLQALALEGLDY